MDQPGIGRDRRIGSQQLFTLVWALLGVVALAIIVTYSRVEPEQVYHFSQSGIAGGLGRALVFSNFPVALIAIAMIGVSLLTLRTGSWLDLSGHRRGVQAVAIVAVFLCLVMAAPGVVDAGDLDPKPINVVPFVGVLLAVALSGLALRHGRWPSRTALDWRGKLSVAVTIVFTIISLPWIVAELGFYIDKLPLIGRLFIASEVPPGETHAAVHLGHHHGFDGLLFVISALTLGHVTRNRFEGGLATAVSGLLALMFTYGCFNLANDAWLEQVVKRDWVEWEIPSVLTPSLSVAWGLILVGSVIVWYALFRSGEPAPEPAKTPARTLKLKAE